MRKLLVLVVIVFLAGCMTVKTYEIEKPRVDTEVKGNQGYLTGSSKEEPKESRLGDTRTISVVELDFGYGKAKGQEPVSKEVVVEEEIYIEEPQSIEDVSFDIEEAPSQMRYESYTVAKNDTLQKISLKFYGTTRKWKKIYDANQDVIKDPNRVYPGKTIKIPLLD
jgi:nucleoid-associated protein YgaU